MYIYIYISPFLCQLFCRSRTRGCGWTLALCQHSGAGQAASHRRGPSMKHVETSSKNAIVAASFSRSRVSWEPFTRSLFSSDRMRSSPWRWTGNQQLQDTRRDGIGSRTTAGNSMNFPDNPNRAWFLFIHLLFNPRLTTLHSLKKNLVQYCVHW